MELKEKIRNRHARIGIIGLGYVGLPLAVEFAKAGFQVTGFDIDVAKIAAINKGHSYIGDVSSEDVSTAVRKAREARIWSLWAESMPSMSSVGSASA